MAKVYVFMAEGFEEIEALTVVDLLRRAQIETYMVSIDSKERVTGAHNIEVTMDMPFTDVNFGEADMLVLPGGMPGTTNLLAHEELIKQLKEHYAKGKMVAAICAAPRILGIHGMLDGKKAVCYPENEGFLKGAEVSYDAVVWDSNVITSRGMGTAIEFASTIIEALIDKETADALKEAIIYRS